jgi:hypothetical protein
VNISKRLLSAIVSLGIIITIIIAIIFWDYWDIILASLTSESTRNWLITLIVAPIIALIIGVLLKYFWAKSALPRLLGRGLYINIEKCMHFPAHSREQKNLTGTKMSVTFCFENNLGKRTALTGVKLIAPYETEKEPPRAPFVLPDGRKSYYLDDVTPARYTHRFFIKDYPILEPKLKCVFRLFYVPHAQKKVKGVSKRQPVK